MHNPLLNPNPLCVFLWEGREEKNERKKTEIETEVMILCGYTMEPQRFHGHMTVYSMMSSSLVSCPLV